MPDRRLRKTRKPDTRGTNPAVSLQEAESQFNLFTGKGVLAYMLNEADKLSGGGTLVREFVKDAEEIVLVPPMAGG